MPSTIHMYTDTDGRVVVHVGGLGSANAGVSGSVVTGGWVLLASVNINPTKSRLWA
jgi:hypothetical protein